MWRVKFCLVKARSGTKLATRVSSADLRTFAPVQHTTTSDSKHVTPPSPVDLSRRHELILKGAGEGIYGLDREGRTTFVNPAAASMLGWHEQELVGRSQHDVIHHTRPDGTPYDAVDCPIYAAFNDGAVHRVDNEVFWRKDGSSFAVEYVSTPIVDDDGNAQGAVVMFRDITERREQEARVHRLQRQNESILRSAGEGIYGLDCEGRTTFVNPAAAEMLGWVAEELLGAVEAVLSLFSQKAEVSFHPPTRLLIARGAHEQLDLVNETIEQLVSSAERRRDEVESIRRDIREVQEELSEATGEIRIAKQTVELAATRLASAKKMRERGDAPADVVAEAQLEVISTETQLDVQQAHRKRLQDRLDGLKEALKRWEQPRE